MHSNSQPSSPVYPVRLTIASTPSIVVSAKVNGGAGGSPSRAIARGPCTARSAQSSETSRTSEPRISRSFNQV
jgi:hypothetical protein